MTVSDGRTGDSSTSDPFEYTDPDATTDQLNEDVEGPDESKSKKVPGSTPVKKRETPLNRIKHAEAAKAEQSNTLRERFFARATFGTGIVIGLNFVVFGFYMASQWGDISEAVMLAWISSTVVEVLGIVYIIARYLFGGDDSQSSGNSVN